MEARRKAKQGSRCLAQQPSWMKLLPLHPWTRYPESYKTRTRNWHLGSKSRFNCVHKFPTKQTPTQRFQESILWKMERAYATDPLAVLQVMKGTSRQQGLRAHRKASATSLTQTHATLLPSAYFPAASTLHLKCILIKEFINCTRSF